MESPAREFDETRLDAAIAAILGDAEADQNASDPEQPGRSEFPKLAAQENIAEQDARQDSGVAAILRQKWAEFSGAA